jgi:hypothetical protein
VAVSALYYVLWMIVRGIYNRLGATAGGALLPEGHVASSPAESCAQAAQHVSDAYELLGNARSRYQRHPELDEAIARLELALSLLTIKTGGML